MIKYSIIVKHIFGRFDLFILSMQCRTKGFDPTITNINIRLNINLPRNGLSKGHLIQADLETICKKQQSTDQI